MKRVNKIEWLDGHGQQKKDTTERGHVKVNVKFKKGKKRIPQHHSTRLDEPFNRQPNSDNTRRDDLEPAQPIPASSAPLPYLLPPTHPLPPPPQLSINKTDTESPSCLWATQPIRKTAYATSPEAGHSGPVKREDKVCMLLFRRSASPFVAAQTIWLFERVSVSLLTLSL